MESLRYVTGEPVTKRKLRYALADTPQWRLSSRETDIRPDVILINVQAGTATNLSLGGFRVTVTGRPGLSRHIDDVHLSGRADREKLPSWLLAIVRDAEERCRADATPEAIAVAGESLWDSL